MEPTQKKPFVNDESEQNTIQKNSPQIREEDEKTREAATKIFEKEASSYDPNNHNNIILKTNTGLNNSNNNDQEISQKNSPQIRKEVERTNEVATKKFKKETSSYNPNNNNHTTPDPLNDDFLDSRSMGFLLCEKNEAFPKSIKLDIGEGRTIPDDPLDMLGYINTLDLQPQEEVATFCGSDAFLSTFEPQDNPAPFRDSGVYSSLFPSQESFKSSSLEPIPEAFTDLAPIFVENSHENVRIVFLYIVSNLSKGNEDLNFKCNFVKDSQGKLIVHINELKDAKPSLEDHNRIFTFESELSRVINETNLKLFASVDKENRCINYTVKYRF